jgi:phosphoserine phosphatase
MRQETRRVTRWREFDHIIFDCDSTLTAVEGIDALADESDQGKAVAALTESAMTGDADLDDVYAKRLDLVAPSRAQVASVLHAYRQNVVPDAKHTVSALMELGRRVYVVSGGLAEPVQEFAMSLGVPFEHVRAVETHFDRLSGTWWTSQHQGESYTGFEDGPLTVSVGKAAIIEELLASSKGRSLLVGDGASDLRAAAAVDLFVGFGGVVHRTEVARKAPVFVSAASLAPVLLLAAGPEARDLLSAEGRGVFDRGAEWAAGGAVAFRDRALGDRFASAFGLDPRQLRPGNSGESCSVS